MGGRLGRNRSFQTALSEHGLTFSGAPLHGAATATSVRVRDDRPLVTDGPFAETKEQLWGFYLVEAPDLDTVVELTAGMWEATHGTVEIRPVIPISEAASVGVGAAGPAAVGGA